MVTPPLTRTSHLIPTSPSRHIQAGWSNRLEYILDVHQEPSISFFVSIKPPGKAVSGAVWGPVHP